MACSQAQCVPSFWLSLVMQPNFIKILSKNPGSPPFFEYFFSTFLFLSEIIEVLAPSSSSSIGSFLFFDFEIAFLPPVGPGNFVEYSCERLLSDFSPLIKLLELIWAPPVIFLPPPLRFIILAMSSLPASYARVSGALRPLWESIVEASPKLLSPL